MTTFDKREEGFEKKFALDEDLKFKAVARRNKLLGQLIAEKLGKSGDEAAAYAKEVVAAVFEGDGDVLRKVLADVKAKGVDMASVMPCPLMFSIAGTVKGIAFAPSPSEIAIGIGASMP